MRVLLIRPNGESVIKEVLGATGPPLGIGYIASYVRDKHDVWILDAMGLNYSEEQVKREIERVNPDIVGISCPATPYVVDVERTAEIVKSVDENIKVVVGGAHVTFMDKQTLRECPWIDFVVRGEGEETMRDLLETLERGGDLRDVEGITYRYKGEIIRTEKRPLIQDLDSIPFPAYDLMPMGAYKIGNFRYSVIITSRGCPFGCVFCSTSHMFGRKWRARSPENVVEELKLLRHKYRVREIEFLDDIFTLNKERAKKNPILADASACKIVALTDL